MSDVEVKKVGGEWCAFHIATGREIARSHDRALLDGYLTDCENPPAPAPRAPAPKPAAPGLPLSQVTYTTRARSTGATTSAGRTETGWGSHCLNHGTLAGWENRTVAETQVSRPQEWCPGCAQIKAGTAPKFIARIDPELEELL